MKKEYDISVINDKLTFSHRYMNHTHLKTPFQALLSGESMFQALLRETDSLPKTSKKK